MECPACGYKQIENDDPIEDNDQFIKIEGSSLIRGNGPKRGKSVNLVACPKCMNIFME